MKITLKTTALAILVSLGVTACGSSGGASSAPSKDKPVVNKPAKKPVTKPTVKPTEKPTNKPAVKPATKPTTMDSKTLNYETDIILTKRTEEWNDESMFGFETKEEKVKFGTINVVLGKNNDSVIFKQLLEKNKNGKSLISDKLIKFKDFGDNEFNNDGSIESFDSYQIVGTTKKYNIKRGNLAYSEVFALEGVDGTNEVHMIGYAGLPTKAEIMKNLTGKARYTGSNQHNTTAQLIYKDNIKAGTPDYLKDSVADKLEGSDTLSSECAFNVDFDNKTIAGNIDYRAGGLYVLKQGSISAKNGEIVFSGKSAFDGPSYSGVQEHHEGEYSGKFMGPNAEELAGKVSVKENDHNMREVTFIAEKEQK